MKRAAAVAILCITFAFGLAVGGWRPRIVGTLKAWLGSGERVFDTPYYRSRLSLFRQTPGSADVVMLGDSITEGVDWHEQFPEVKILNRGIGGDTSKGVLNRLDEVIGRHPRIVFLMIGVNDLLSGVPVATADANIRLIVIALVQKKIHVVLQTTIYATPQYWPEINDRINELNRSLSDLCTTSEVVCVDLNRALADRGALSWRFSWDGLHLNAAGYLAWKNEIEAEITKLRTQ